MNTTFICACATFAMSSTAKSVSFRQKRSLVTQNTQQS